ncbi:insecticidal toxin complex protein TccC [Pseudomonas arsenicoxydans]|uniref:Insecticidal toxin complex protein TccC n=1 Tax=Pseudomonas arsenicoxydans TaxID=702115 RepID=A0A1H0TK80_9PSED|nr:RHS repeat-associated core domain-containing protein [Pseudomonas arsenicoxydans]SDP54472.1 insecticidal toxin complex protein TccC [Pseudomonas arsenicoxydans]
MPASTMGMHYNTPKVSVIDPRGLPVCSVDYWREVENISAQARFNRTLYDAAGFPIKQWDPRLWELHKDDPAVPANLTTLHSLLGHPVCTNSVDAGSTVSLFGLADQVLFSWDSRGIRREVEYDDLLRPLAVFEHLATEPRRCAERMEYGRAEPSAQDRNQCGQLIRQDGPGGTSLFESFAITGPCTRQVQHFTLEAVAPDWPEPIVEREALVEPGEGAISTWRYSQQGNVLEMVDARQNTQRFDFTVDGRLRQSELKLAGKLTWQTLVRDIEYNAQGKITHEVSGKNISTALKYGPEDGRLMERCTHGEHTNVLQHLVYAYDRMGNVLSIEDKALAVRFFNNQRIEAVSRFIYDSLGRLIESIGWEAGAPNQGPASVGRNDPAALSNYRQTYCYDKGDNLLKLTHVGAQSPGRQLEAARHSNRCLPWRNGVRPSEDDIAAAFDARGNLLELDQGRFLTWDLRNQLHSVSPVERASRNDSECYFYDGTGQRVRKIRSLQTNARTVKAEVRYLPGLELRTDSGTGEVLHVITAQAGLNTVRVLHWESDPPSGVNDQYRYSLVDHLKSCTMELADDAHIISQEVFYPFGETAWFTGSDVDYKTIRYSGKERDATGLYYYGFRYFISWLQRWLSPDPAGSVDGFNYYAMVANSPVTFMDIDGYAKGDANDDETEASRVSVRSRAALFGGSSVAPVNNGRNVTAKPIGNVLSPANKPVLPAVAAKSSLKQVRETGDTQERDARETSENVMPGGSGLSTSDVSMSFKEVKVMRNREEKNLTRLVVVFHRPFDLVEGKNVPKWPEGHEIVPSQDWINKEGIEEYGKFNSLTDVEREKAISAIKAKDPAALKIGLGSPVFAINSEAKIITLQDGHHRFIAAAKSGGTVELNKAQGPTSMLKWRDLKYSGKRPLKV